MRKLPQFAEIARVLEQRSQFLLVCHERADGDALGSLLGLGLPLRSLGKSAIMYSPGGVPEAYSFLPHAQEIIPSLEAGSHQEVEVVVCLDCDGLARAGALSQWLDDGSNPADRNEGDKKQDLMGRRPLLIDIDHHEPEKGFGEIRLITPKAAATALLVYAILKEMRVRISKEVATCLLTGLYLDTGSLRYENTDAEVFRVAGELTALGAEPSFVARGLYDTKSLPALQLLGRALCSASTASGGKIVFALLTPQDFQEAGAEREEIEGIIDLLRANRDATVAALFIQHDSAEVKVSLRSRGKVDVAAIASRYGGGGHARAAGFTLPGRLGEVIPTIIDEIQRSLP